MTTEHANSRAIADTGAAKGKPKTAEQRVGAGSADAGSHANASADGSHDNASNDRSHDTATAPAAVAQKINANLKGHWVRVGSEPDRRPAGLGTGFEALDRLTGFGGLPRGRLTELVGRATSGRTTVAARTVAQVEGFSAWVDVSGHVDVDGLARCGVDLGQLYIVRPECPADALPITVQLVASGDLDLVVLDSLSDVAEGGPTSRTVNHFVRVLTPRLGGSDTAAVVLTNPEHHQPGLAAAAALRLAFAPTGIIRLAGVFRGWRTRVTALKAPGHLNESTGLEVWEE